MNIIFYKLSNALKFFPIELLKKITGQNSIFPFYHTVSNDTVPHIKHLYSIRTVDEFEKDLDFFLKHYKPIEIESVIHSKTNGVPIEKNSFLVSFDDGLSEIHEIIAPILLRKGIPAVFFINSGFVDNKDLFFRYKASLLIDTLNKKKYTLHTENSILEWFQKNNLSIDNVRNSLLSINYNTQSLLDELARMVEFNFNDYLKLKKPYMSSAQINELIEKGFAIGAHSIDHPQYSDIDCNTQIKQTKESIEFISTTFNTKYKTFSFPFTDYCVSKKFFDSMYQPNKEAVDITFGCAGLKKDSITKNIQRIPIEIDNFSAKDVVTGEYLYFILKAFLNKNIIRRT